MLRPVKMAQCTSPAKETWWIQLKET